MIAVYPGLGKISNGAGIYEVEGLVGVQVMYKLDGQDEDRNFFSHPFTNILAPAESVPVKVLQATFTASVNTVDLLPKGR